MEIRLISNYKFMETLAQLLGLDPDQLTFILGVAVFLVIILVVLRIMRKITAALMRIGCFGLIVVVGGLYVFNVLG